MRGNSCNIGLYINTILLQSDKYRELREAREKLEEIKQNSQVKHLNFISKSFLFHLNIKIKVLPFISN